MKTFIFVSVLMSFSFLATAQKPTTNNGADNDQLNFTVPKKDSWLDRFEKRQTKMIQLLSLSEQQKRRLDTLNDHYVTQRATIHEDKTLNMKARLAKVETMRRQRESKFKSILNDSQLSKWNDLRKTQKKKTFRKK